MGPTLLPLPPPEGNVFFFFLATAPLETETLAALGLTSSRDLRELPGPEPSALLSDVSTTIEDDCFLDSEPGDTLEFVVLEGATIVVCFSTAAAEVTLLLENNLSDSLKDSQSKQTISKNMCSNATGLSSINDFQP